MILDLMITNTSKPLRNIKIGVSLCCRDNKPMEFTVLRDMGQAKSQDPELQEIKILALQGVRQ